MRTAILLSACALLLLVAVTASVPSARAADDDAAAIQKRWAEFVAAWGKHDPKALAAPWAEDGDLLNPWGRWAKAGAEVEKLFADEQTGQGPLRESTFASSGETVRLVSADVAVSDAEVTISGGLAPGGAKGPAMDFHVPCVWKKVGGTWSVVAARPYLKAPPPGAPK